MYKPWKGHLEVEQPKLGDLLTTVANYVLNGLILQVSWEISKNFLAHLIGDRLIPERSLLWVDCGILHVTHQKFSFLVPGT